MDWRTSSLLLAGQPNAAPLVDLGKIDSATSVTWLANLGPGIAGFLNLRDNTGTVAQSGPFTVQSGSNTTCVGQTPVPLLCCPLRSLPCFHKLC
ncbi:hypothetical protein CPC08DRAFT_203518 [Agrocybe pediades]|nr:hypothetical protein CPC08DRAFT_203518 [Agrocybe pediades]